MNAVVAGVWSAWRTPLALGRLGTLTGTLASGGGGGGGGVAASSSEAQCALRTAQRTLAWLARLPGGRWRTTCLYRSVAECLALRAVGVEARVAIAVSQELMRAPTQELVTGPRVVAHAWVEGASGTTLGSASANRDMTPLRASASSAGSASTASSA